MEKLTDFEFLEEKGSYLFMGQVENLKLKSFYVFNKEEKSKVGNIYRARLVDKIKGLNGFFVYLGEDKRGFVQFDQEKFQASNEADEVILQVVYDGNKEKGPKLTDKYEIKGKYFIFTPFNKNIKVSKKFRNIDQAKRIKSFFQDKVKDIGFVIRTEAEFASSKDLQIEFDQLLSICNNLQLEKNFSPTPKLLYEYDYLKEYVDLNSNSFFISNNKAYIDKFSAYKNDLNYIYQKDFSINKHKEIYAEIKELFNKKVLLDNGIELVFEKTEAFNVIDINSKSFFNSGKDGTKDVNINSVNELIRNIHLRNIYGIILVDFISYSKKSDEKLLLNYFFQESKKYKNPINVIGFTKLGILELTRNKAVNNLSLEDLDPSIFK